MSFQAEDRRAAAAWSHQENCLGYYGAGGWGKLYNQHINLEGDLGNGLFQIPCQAQARKRVHLDGVQWSQRQDY